MYNIYIRPLQFEDAVTSHRWRNDPEVWKFTGSRPDREITLVMEQEWISKVLADSTSRRFAIMADEQYVGNIQLTGITDTTAEYHIFIGDKNWWGKGISAIATYQLLHFAKEELALTSVRLSVLLENAAAVKVYLKNGFKKTSEEEGVVKMNCDLAQLPPPMVSVFVMVYNHEEYLTECLDGILMQQCNFTYNIVVGEDCSTDRSRKILLDYRRKYPGKFKLFLHEQNIGAVANQNALFAACSGKYIALCEGDDYWIDPLKLHKQVEILEKNPDIKICAHPSKRRYGNVLKRDKYGYWGDTEIIIDIKTVIKNYSTTAPLQSIMFKNEKVADLITILEKLLGGHSTIQIFYSLENGLIYIPEYMSVYRVDSSSSVSKTLFRYDKKYLRRQIVNWSNIDLLDKYSRFEYKTQFRELRKRKVRSVLHSSYPSVRQLIYLCFKFGMYKDLKVVFYRIISLVTTTGKRLLS